MLLSVISQGPNFPKGSLPAKRIFETALGQNSLIMGTFRAQEIDKMQAMVDEVPSPSSDTLIRGISN